MNMRRGLPARLLALALSLVLALSVAFVSASAQPAPDEPGSIVSVLTAGAGQAEPEDEEEPEDDGEPADDDEEDAPEASPSLFARLWDLFWGNTQFLSYMFNFGENYAYNSRFSFQWIFGFNPIFDFMAPVAGCFIDTLRSTFEYEGRTWKLQMWKGSYLYGLTTGGEIGLYSKPLSRPFEHYDSAGVGDWIGMEMTIYHNDDFLFTRPMQTRWWQTGYSFIITDNVFNSKHITLLAALRFNSPGMAQAYAQTLAGKGFTLVDALPTENHRHQLDMYTIQGSTVRVLWRSHVD